MAQPKSRLIFSGSCFSSPNFTCVLPSQKVPDSSSALPQPRYLLPTLPRLQAPAWAPRPLWLRARLCPLPW